MNDVIKKISKELKFSIFFFRLAQQLISYQLSLVPHWFLLLFSFFSKEIQLFTFPRFQWGNTADDVWMTNDRRKKKCQCSMSSPRVIDKVAIWPSFFSMELCLSPGSWDSLSTSRYQLECLLNVRWWLVMREGEIVKTSTEIGLCLPAQYFHFLKFQISNLAVHLVENGCRCFQILKLFQSGKKQIKRETDIFQPKSFLCCSSSFLPF